VTRDGRNPEDVRRDIAAERQRLAQAVGELRADLVLKDKLGGKLPVLAAGALGAGFVLFGGVGATMRYFARRGREGREKARVGPFSLTTRD
jgi:hypothetical protein